MQFIKLNISRTYMKESIEHELGVQHLSWLPAGTQHWQQVVAPEVTVGAVDLRDVAEQPGLVNIRQDASCLQVRQAGQEQLECKGQNEYSKYLFMELKLLRLTASYYTINQGTYLSGINL